MGAKWSPERKAAWRAKMAEVNNKPASGMPASGPGWGGEAKGNGKGGRRAPPLPTDPASQSEHAKAPRDFNRIARREELEGFWSSVVFDEDEATNYRIAAAEKLYDRRYAADDKDPAAGQIVITGGLPDDA